MPGDTGNKRAVRILLECILVMCLSADYLKMSLVAFAVGLGLMVGGLVSSIIETYCRDRAVIGALLYGFAGTL